VNIFILRLQNRIRNHCGGAIFNHVGGRDMGNNTRPNPDDRRDNVERIEYNIGKTIQNMKRAEDMIQITDDEKTKQDLIEKNERRRDALKGMREEIREEAIARKNNYQ
jgi:small acid-soluble spore protein (thioredoxin-like protein)